MPVLTPACVFLSFCLTLIGWRVSLEQVWGQGCAQVPGEPALPGRWRRGGRTTPHAWWFCRKKPSAEAGGRAGRPGESALLRTGSALPGRARCWGGCPSPPGARRSAGPVTCVYTTAFSESVSSGTRGPIPERSLSSGCSSSPARPGSSRSGRAARCGLGSFVCKEAIVLREWEAPPRGCLMLWGHGCPGFCSCGTNDTKLVT